MVDHSNDAEVENFFKKIEKDENGKLDVLVNNAFSAVNTILNSVGKPFWTLDPVEQWDAINGVGLRNHYLCTVYGSRYLFCFKNFKRQKHFLLLYTSLFNKYDLGPAVIHICDSILVFDIHCSKKCIFCEY